MSFVVSKITGLVHCNLKDRGTICKDHETSLYNRFHDHAGRKLSFLMPVLPQALFPFVSGHLVAFSLFSARHTNIGLDEKII